MTAPAAKPAMLPFARPCISEAAVQAVAAVLRSGWITSGPKVVEFEQAFAAATGAANAIAVNSATTGLDLVFAALDLQPGDEVIVPSINWVSGPNMVELNGGTCVFCEVVPGTLNCDLDHVARLIGPRTRAIMPVHFAGAPVDLDRLRALVAGRPITIVEDCAHAAGARFRGRPIGGDSEVAVFSFHPTKNLTTAEGGMITCRDGELAARLRVLRFHGIRKDAWKNHSRSGKDLYNVTAPGRKGNLPDTLAVLGIHQLADLERMNAERARLAAIYQRELAGLRLCRPLDQALGDGDLHAWHIFVVLVAPGVERAAVVDGLERRGIGTALHFPPVHSQTFYRQKYPGCALPASEDVGARLLTIPLFPGMGDDDVARVVAALRQVEAELLP
jgi:UDP-4-amino-4-deoxy-L-arabinose-oxoglutarate aminotransferase